MIDSSVGVWDGVIISKSPIISNHATRMNFFWRRIFESKFDRWPRDKPRCGTQRSTPEDLQSQTFRIRRPGKNPWFRWVLINHNLVFEIIMWLAFDRFLIHTHVALSKNIQKPKMAQIFLPNCNLPSVGSKVQVVMLQWYLKLPQSCHQNFEILQIGWLPYGWRFWKAFHRFLPTDRKLSRIRFWRSPIIIVRHHRLCKLILLCSTHLSKQQKVSRVQFPYFTSQYCQYCLFVHEIIDGCVRQVNDCNSPITCLMSLNTHLKPNFTSELQPQEMNTRTED